MVFTVIKRMDDGSRVEVGRVVGGSRRRPLTDARRAAVNVGIVRREDRFDVRPLRPTRQRHHKDGA